MGGIESPAVSFKPLDGAVLSVHLALQTPNQQFITNLLDLNYECTPSQRGWV